MNASVPQMDADTWSALERLIEIARGDSGQSRYAANFLLAWWNAAELGGFDFTDAWGVDGAAQDDMVRLFGFIARHSVYPNAYSFRSEFEDLVRRWRPEVLADAGRD
jgi:hypothetical protein